MKWPWLLLRALAGLITVALFGVVALSLVIGYLANSDQGTRWLFDLARDHAPGELRAQQIQGRLSGPLEIRGLSFRDGDLSLGLDLLRLDWRPSELLKLHLSVRELALRGIRVDLPETQDETPDPQPAEPFSGFSLPLRVSLESLRLDDLRLKPSPAAEPLELERLVLRAGAQDRTLRIEQLEAAGFDAVIALAGELRLASGLPMALDLDWEYQVPDGPGLKGSGRLHGDLARLELDQDLAAPLSAKLRASLFELEANPRWDANIDLENADLGAFAPDFPATLSGRLHSAGNPEDIEAEADLTLVQAELGELALALSGGFAGGSAEIRKLTLSTPGGAQLDAVGRYTPDDQAGRLEADLNWRELSWPLVGDAPRFLSREGSASLRGRPADYRFELDLAAQLPGVAAGEGSAPAPVPLGLTGEGSGGLEGLTLQRLRLALGEGALDVAGQVAWDPRPSWRLSLQGAGLDPGLLHPDFPGELALDATSEGEIRGPAGPLVALDLKALEGVLRDYPLKAAARVRVDGETAAIEAFELDSGGNLARLSGSAGKRLDLDWSIQAPRLEALWPGLAGGLQGAGSLQGAAATPRIQADLSGKGIRFEDNEVQGLSLKADLDLGSGQQLDLDLDATGLAAAGMAWRGLELSADGTRASHRIALALEGRDVPQAKLALQAGMDQKNTWSGRLDSLRLQVPEIGDWRLLKPVAFELGERRQHLDQVCLADGEARLCAGFDGMAEQGWRAELDAPDFPLDFFQPWLPAELKIVGRSQLRGRFEADAKGRVQGQAELDLPSGRVDFALAGENQKLDFSGGSARALLDAKGARVDLQLPLAGLGGIEGGLTLPGFSAPELEPRKQAVKGRIQADIRDLGLVSLVAPDIQNVRGHIEADFAVSGTLAKPRLKGSADLREAALDIPEAGLELRDLSFKLSAPTLESLRMEGGVSSGDGRLSFQGDTRLDADKGFPTQLKVSGQDWVAVNIPEAELHVSPDLSIAHDSAQTRLDGEIRIPYARIRPRELPAGAVSSSSDLVMVGGENPDRPEPDPNFHSKLRIVFGDRVSFEGFGLRARLSGDLLVIDEPGRPVIGRGRVGIAEGTYRAYGQDLKIERGFALFADSPVDNPGLDVRAVREAGEVTAGLRVTGTLKTPKLDLFSTPAMAEGEILSYLLTGRAPGESGGEVGVTAALAASGVGSLSSEVGRQLGLEELRVDTGSGLADASVVAGTYLSPRLYVQYVNELATRETKLRLRYDLTDRLQIQTETGRTQGVDLFYTIER